MKTVPLKTIRVHIIAWSILISYEVLTVLPRYHWRFANFWDYAAHYTLYILLFYFNAHMALTWTMRGAKKRYLLYFLTVILQLAVYTGVKYFILYLFNFLRIPLAPPFKNNTDYILNGIFRGIYFLGLSTAYWFALSTIQNRKRIADLENSQLRNKIVKNTLESAILTTENDYLKSQINPHFLFNTLGFIHNSVSKFSTTIAESVISLSEIMRYALAATDADGKVELVSEIEHIENFIKLNQARFNQKLSLNFSVSGEISDQRIIPLILITLVENVFKYGNLNNPASPASIILTLNGNELLFITENSKKRQNNITSYGVGIKNLKSRLAVYHRFSLEIEEKEQSYRSILKIWF